jgi:hypothetical protein
METPDPSLEPASLARREVKVAVQELLRSGFIDSAHKPALFNSISRLRPEIASALDPLDLRVMLDDHRGLAILRVAETAAENPAEEWGHLLVRRQRLTLEQSLLVAILRQFYVIQEQETGIGVTTVKVPLEDLLAQLTVFLGDSGSDAKNENRLITLLDQLKPHGIVSEPDQQREVTIRPLIAHLANPETLTVLLAHFREVATKLDPAHE